MTAARPPADWLRSRSRLVSAVALTLAAAACSGTSSAVDPRDSVPTPASIAPVTPVLPTVTATLPLTGQPAATPELAARPIVAVAVEAGSGLPASAGIGNADLVYVSFPSTHRQRGLALFQSKDSDRVGPVADTRPLDGKLLRTTSAVLEHSGGTSGFVKQVGRADLPQWSSLVHPSSFARDPASGALYGSTSAARAAEGVQPARPGLLAFSDPGTPLPTATAAAPTGVRIEVSGQDPISVSYDAATGTWRGSVGGLSVAATNVVVQQVTYASLVLPKTGGRTEGSPDPDGTGSATLLSGPQVDQGTWNRPGGGTSTKYVHHDGTPARFAPGPTWVLLVPTGTPVTPS